MNTSDSPVDVLLANLTMRLPSRLVRAPDLLTEFRDGLEDATRAYEHTGLRRVEAEKRAVADFGSLDEVAAACARSAASRTTRLAAAQLGGGYVLILATWAGLARVLPPSPTGRESALASWAFPVLGVLAVVVSVVAVVASRHAARHGGRSSAVSARLIGIVGLLCAVSTLIISYAVQPWPTRSAGPAHLRDVVETLSGVVVLVIMISATRCLLAAQILGDHSASSGRPPDPSVAVLST